MHNIRLILASTSPRRKQLLAAAGYDFEVIPPQVNELTAACGNGGPAEMVMHLARLKAADVMRQIEARQLQPSPSVVVGCDTTVECKGQVFGKPTDRDHARRMLATLSGGEHRVYSGLCLWPLAAAEPQTDFAVTTLRMDRLGGQQLDDYLATRAWEGKAGAFGYQDGLDWLQIVEGSAANVVGLPVELLDRMLQAAFP